MTYRLFFLVLLSCSVTILPAQKSPVQDYQIKAIFLLNFTRFVEWPANTFPTEETPIIIGILGEDPFGSYLDEVLAGEKVNGRSVMVVRYKEMSEIEHCHLLYIKIPESDGLENILKTLAERNILTISDADLFIQKGGMIRFINVNKKIHFQINPDAAKAANINISSKLLSLAEIVAFNKEK